MTGCDVIRCIRLFVFTKRFLSGPAVEESAMVPLVPPPLAVLGWTPRCQTLAVGKVASWLVMELWFREASGPWVPEAQRPLSLHGSLACPSLTSLLPQSWCRE
ncbi:hypothetical protein DPEC_G00227220 [Dallia pectoralis]|uniref:Uncharacterized protein n=1 Tax=Dallia pectoralis TaxID=75939 RepID=A0ACC2G0K5_DALPE|nr:hypothetical protein DPEC_G00227220 [Dallia pectoralis]